jgi:hydroxyacylglutathione hydrolase
MKRLADDIFLLKTSLLSPNVYRAGRTIIDSGTRLGARRVVSQLHAGDVDVLVLTHVHPPTQGGSHGVCEALSLELWCGEHEVTTAESGATAAAQPDNWFNPFQQRLFGGPGHRVARALREGDTVEDFEVLDVPGHAPGHIALWRDRDRVLFVGDVVTNQNVWTGVRGLREPPPMFTPDVPRNRESARRLASLRPALALFSHGRPLRDPDRLERFVATLG